MMSGIMFVRLGSFAVKPGALSALRSIYYDDCAPLVRSQPGNVDCFLLENVTAEDAIIACTMWRAEEDARLYEASGAAADVVAKVRSFFAGPPALASFRVVRP